MYKKHEIEIIAFEQNEAFVVCTSDITYGGESGSFDDSEDDGTNTILLDK